MNRIVIIVSDGVADYSADDDVEVCLIDMDDVRGDNALSLSDYAGFEDLLPDYVTDHIEDSQ